MESRKTIDKFPSVGGDGPEGVCFSQQLEQHGKEAHANGAYVIRRDGTKTSAWVYCPEAGDVLVVA